MTRTGYSFRGSLLFSAVTLACKISRGDPAGNEAIQASTSDGRSAIQRSTV
ncbi:MAG: hypothetical protein QM755_10480 [Luteolibacter sp.]